MFKYYMIVLLVLSMMLVVQTYRTDERKINYENTIMAYILLMALAVAGFVAQKMTVSNRELPPKEEEIQQVKISEATEKMIYASPKRSCSCIVEKEDVEGFIELIETDRKEELAIIYKLMLSHNKILLIERNTRVKAYETEEYRGFIPVVFMEGEYKGRRAYVMKKRLISAIE